jgi:hypothetical protein
MLVFVSVVRIAGIPLALSVVALATGCLGDGGRYAGLSEEEAKTQVREWDERARTFGTFQYAEAARAKTPRGMDAWLVLVAYEGGSLLACAYIWREEGHAAEIRSDENCRHWKFD